MIPTPVPTLSFSSVSFDGLPAGDYWVGVSCVKQDGQFVPQTERFWSLAITITAGTGNEYTYGLADVADTTTTTTSTTTTTTTVVEAATTTVSVTTSSVSSPETTIDGASVTTTDPGASTTTDPDGSTSTTPVTTVAVYLPSSGGPSGTSYSPAGTLAVTGTSPAAMIGWGVLLLVLGRFAVLLGRRTRIVPVQS